MSLNKIKCLLAVMLPLIALQNQCAFGQGSLTPPGSPAPTMKTLSQIEPRTAISSAPFAITSAGSYYLTTNLSSGSSGISIGAGNVTLDLNGFTIQGGSSFGIYVAGDYTNITVRNGSVIGFSNTGVDGYTFGFPRNLLIENMTVSGGGSHGIFVESDSIVRSCRSYGNTGLGIYAHGGKIEDCVVRANSGGGINIVNGVARDCHAENNIGVGIDCNGGSVLDCSSFNSTSYGIRLFGGASARGCNVHGNGNAGIFAYNSGPTLGGAIADCLVVTNTYGINILSPGYLVTGNEVSYNTPVGIIVQTGYNRIDGNHIIVTPGNLGIQISSASISNNVIVRNSVMGNGNIPNNYNIAGTNNDLGPIGNATTNMSPWANFSR